MAKMDYARKTVVQIVNMDMEDIIANSMGHILPNVIFESFVIHIILITIVLPVQVTTDIGHLFFVQNIFKGLNANNVYVVSKDSIIVADIMVVHGFGRLTVYFVLVKKVVPIVDFIIMVLTFLLV